MRSRIGNYGEISGQDRGPRQGDRGGGPSAGTAGGLGTGLLSRTAARLKRLKRLNANPSDILNKQLDSLTEYDDWPLPEKCSERLSPEYLGEVYSGGRKGIDYGRTYLQAHALEGSHIGNDFLRLLIALDNFILYDGVNVVNSSGVEILVRYLYGIEKTMSNVTKKDHHSGSENQRRTQWELFRRYDTVDFYGKGVEAKAADRAVQEDMAQDATFLKYYSKVKGSRDAAPEAAPVK